MIKFTNKKRKKLIRNNECALFIQRLNFILALIYLSVRLRDFEQIISQIIFSSRLNFFIFFYTKNESQFDDIKYRQIQNK